MYNKFILFFFVFLLFCCNISIAGEKQPLKVICASRAELPPLIDGKLTDECWQKTEARGDFIPPAGDPDPVKRKTTMRIVYDDKNLYIGLEFHWEDINILKNGIRKIMEKHPSSKGKVNIRNYSNSYGVELFIDPGLSEVNYYQILFNAAGQIAGHYKLRWDLFKDDVYFKSSVNGSSWTAEFVYPFKDLMPGNEWGLNVCRNDETYYGIWKQMGTSYNNPKKFARLVIGGYAEWWNAVWGSGANSRLEDISKSIDKFSKQAPLLSTIYKIVLERAGALNEIAKQHPPKNRENFEVLYKKYNEFKKSFDRLENLYQTQRAMNDAKN